jgi:hypothetical protein
VNPRLGEGTASRRPDAGRSPTLVICNFKYICLSGLWEGEGVKKSRDITVDCHGRVSDPRLMVCLACSEMYSKWLAGVCVELTGPSACRLMYTELCHCVSYHLFLFVISIKISIFFVVVICSKSWQ